MTQYSDFIASNINTQIKSNLSHNEGKDFSEIGENITLFVRVETYICLSPVEEKKPCNYCTCTSYNTKYFKFLLKNSGLLIEQI